MANKKKVSAPVLAKFPTSRPSKNTPEIRQEIADRLSKGEPLAQICRDEWMPAWRTVYQWMENDAAFNADIVGARARGYDVIAQDCLSIADDGKNDFMQAMADGGDEKAAAYVLNGEHIQRSKLRVETRLKLLAKWDPKRYGERQQVDVNDVTPPRPIEEVRARIAELMAKANGH